MSRFTRNKKLRILILRLSTLTFRQYLALVCSSYNLYYSGTFVLWTPYIEPIKSDQIIKVFQVILYERVLFGTIIKCLDYAGVLIFQCSHQQV